APGASAACAPAGAGRRPLASATGPSRRGSSCCSRSSPTLAFRRRRLPRISRPRRQHELPPRRATSSPSTSRSRGGGGRPFQRSFCPRSSRRATTPATRATPGSPATPTPHSTPPPRRDPDLVVHRALLRELGAADDPPPDDPGELAEHTSAREREAADIEYRADAICLAWLLDSALYDRGWDEPFDGEITGVIGSGPFPRFGDVLQSLPPPPPLP